MGQQKCSHTLNNKNTFLSYNEHDLFLTAILCDLLRRAPSTYILPIKFSIVYINQ